MSYDKNNRIFWINFWSNYQMGLTVSSYDTLHIEKLIMFKNVQNHWKVICFPYTSNSHNSGSIGPNHIIMVTTGRKMG